MFEHVVDRHDVRVIETRHSDCLTAETLCDNGIGCKIGFQPFHCDPAIKLLIDRHPDLGHSTLANATVEAITTSEHLGVVELALRAVGVIEGGHEQQER